MPSFHVACGLDERVKCGPDLRHNNFDICAPTGHLRMTRDCVKWDNFNSILSMTDNKSLGYILTTKLTAFCKSISRERSWVSGQGKLSEKAISAVQSICLRNLVRFNIWTDVERCLFPISQPILSLQCCSSLRLKGSSTYTHNFTATVYHSFLLGPRRGQSGTDVWAPYL